MSRIVKTLICVLAGLWAGQAFAAADSGQGAAAGFFCSAPVDVVSYLPDYARLDMIDYFTSGSAVGASNGLGAKVSIRSMRDDELVYADGDSVVTTLVVLPGEKSDTTLMVIRTLPAPMRDSRVTFYDSKWRRLTGRDYPAVPMSRWLAGDAGLPDNPEELPFVLSVASYDPSSRVLTFTNVTSEFFTGTERPAVLDALKPELKFVWTGRKFKQL